MPIRIKLEDLKLSEVSFVDAGDNPPARILLFKDAHGLPVGDEEAENVEVDGNDLYVLSQSGVVYMIQDPTVEGDQVTGTITVLYDPAEEEAEPDAPDAPDAPAPAMKSAADVRKTIAARAGEIARKSGISHEQALGKLAKTDEGRQLRAMLADLPEPVAVEEPVAVHPLTKMAARSPAIAKLKPRVEEVMRRDGVGYEQALGRVKRDPANFELVEAYRAERAS